MNSLSACLRPMVLGLALALVLPGAAANEGLLGPANEHGQFRYLIEFAEPGLLHLHTRAPGERFDPNAPEVAAHRDVLRAQHAAHREAIATALSRTPDVTHHYLVTHSGMAVWLTPVEADIVRSLRGVVSVERERLESLSTFRGPSFIGADTIWDGSAVPGGTGTRGEGVVIAVIDTGVDPEHPSFTNDATCGHGAGDTPDKLLSFVDCLTTDGDGRCNGPLPFDTQSHGSHVASTAGGNLLDQTVDPPPAPFEQISGVAPCAHIRSYKACPDLACLGSAIQASMNTILLDGDVAVMNFSISGGRSPWTDNDRRKLDLVAADVMVAASAGNTGPNIPDPVGQVNHLGPWVLTVAASTHDRAGPTLSAAGPGVPPEDTQSLALVKGSSETPLAVPSGAPFAGKPIRRFDDPLGDEAEGCAPFPPVFFQGAVALIKRGTCAFAHKIVNAEAAGAEMVIIRNNEPGAFPGWNAGQPTVPAYGMRMDDGEALAGWIGQHPDDATADFRFDTVEQQGDVLADFSLRGPTPAPLQHLTKPDITAPGVAIFAGEPSLVVFPPTYGVKSGTSMSSPHAAGAAALLRAVHPDWTVAEVKSALMMTAFTGGTKDDETTAWDADDVGGGRVDLGKAARVGLVMDETIANYLAANPAAGGDVRTLNLPAVRDVACSPDCTWTRTVRNTLAAPASWSVLGNADAIALEVTPSSFSFSGDTGETQVLTITATPVGDQSAAIAFGELVFIENGGLAPDQRITVAVRGTGDPGEPGEPGEPPEVTVVDDDDPAVDYRRGWHRRSDGEASGGGYHRRMGSPGGGETPTARLVFEGQAITYFFGRSEQGGTADVFVDGELVATVDYSGAAPGNAPEFGHSVSFDGLGEGSHEILIAHRSGAVYVDGFEIVSGDGGGTDASAAATQSVTTASTGQLPGLGTTVLLRTVDVGPADRWLSVVVDGAAAPVNARLLDPLGAPVAGASQLLSGSSAAGFDVVPVMAGTYTVQVLDTLGQPATVEISIARTIALD